VIEDRFGKNKELISSDDTLHIEIEDLQEILKEWLIVNNFSELLEELEFIFAEILHLVLILGINSTCELRVDWIEVES